MNFRSFAEEMNKVASEEKKLRARDYYSRPEVQKQIQSTPGPHAVRMITGPEEYIIRRYNPDGSRIDLKDDAQYKKWTNQRMIEVFQETPKSIDTLTLDLDASSPQDKQRALSRALAVQKKMPGSEVYDTGGRGYHVVSPVPKTSPKQGRQKIRQILRQMPIEPGVKDDVAVLQTGGLLRIPGSLHRETLKPMKKIAYGSKTHEEVTNKIVPRSASKAVRQQIIDGAVKADESIRHPYLPWTDPIHSFGGSQDRERINKNIRERLDSAAGDVARGLLSSGMKKEVLLAKGFSDYGEATHMLMDRSAHYEKPLSRGSAAIRSRQALGAIGTILPGYGGLGVGAIEHMSERVPEDLRKGKMLHEQIALDFYEPKLDKDDKKVLRNMKSLKNHFADNVKAHLESTHNVHRIKARQLVRDMYSQDISEDGKKWGDRLRNVSYLGREAVRAAKALRPAIVKAGAAQPKMKIIAVGKELGAGHISQAKNLQEAALKRGIDAEIVDYHDTFGRKGRRTVKRLGKLYDEMSRNKPVLGPFLLEGMNQHSEIDREKVKAFGEANRDAAIVTTWTPTQFGMTDLKQPTYLFYTDQSRNMYDHPALLAANKLRGAGPRIHVGEKAVVAPYKGKEDTIALKALPVSSKVLKSRGAPRLMTRDNFNITVSGGGLGMDVAEASEQVLRSKNLPENVKVHAIAGRGKQTMAKLKRMKKRYGDRLEVHGFAPLPDMMRSADLNIVRGHGTSIAEAQTSGKPAVYFAGNGKLQNLQNVLTRNNVLQVGKNHGSPVAADLDSITPAVEKSIKNYGRLSRKAKRLQGKIGDPAGEAVEKIMKHHSRSMKKVARKERNWGRIAAGVGAGALAGAGAYALSRRGIRRQAWNAIKRIFHGPRPPGKIPAQAKRQAKAIVSNLVEQGIDPSTARIAIAGTGGVGKTTLAKALGEEIGTSVHHVDDILPKIFSPEEWNRLNPKKMAPKGGIFEHTFLLSGKNPDDFHAIINLEKPLSQVKQQILQRGKGAAQIDLYNYGDKQRAVRAAFENTAGKTIRPHKEVSLKIKPKGGFQADQRLDSTLRGMGISPAGLDREAKAVAIAQGKKPNTSSTWGLVSWPTVNKWTGATAAGGAAGGGAAYYYQAKNKKRSSDRSRVSRR